MDSKQAAETVLRAIETLRAQARLDERVEMLRTTMRLDERVAEFRQQFGFPRETQPVQ